MDTYKLKKPVVIDGKETTELKYDLDRLGGKDIQDAINELHRDGIAVGALELDSNYHAAVFAKACGLAYADMLLLSAKDYTKVCLIVRDFFLEDSEV